MFGGWFARRKISGLTLEQAKTEQRKLKTKMFRHALQFQHTRRHLAVRTTTTTAAATFTTTATNHTPSYTHSPPERLSFDTIQHRIPMHWSYNVHKEAIERQFLFPDFKHAFHFMTRVAQYAESVNHHPEWFNVYNQVHVLLRTHDCNGISINDLEMAQRMNELFVEQQEQQEQQEQKK